MSEREPSDEMLMRLADGEMTGPEATMLRTRIAADPALAARYALFERTRHAAAAAFAPLAEQPVPDRLLAAVLAADAAARHGAASAPGATVVPLPQRRRWPSLVPLALAASVAALLAAPAGYLLGRGGAGQEAALRDPLAGARAEVAVALERVPSGMLHQAGGVAVRPLASHEVAGGVCRDFRLEAAGGAMVGIACRDAAGWTMRASAVLEGGDALRGASADHPVIAAALERLGAEPPMDAAREAVLLGRGWR
jgi:anti-sigma factor RsiW